MNFIHTGNGNREVRKSDGGMKEALVQRISIMRMTGANEVGGRVNEPKKRGRLSANGGSRYI